jgi:hypothetical protein
LQTWQSNGKEELKTRNSRRKKRSRNKQQKQKMFHAERRDSNKSEEEEKKMQKDENSSLKLFIQCDLRRDRTCNLLIRSQAPCHWASRPLFVEDRGRYYISYTRNQFW